MKQKILLTLMLLTAAFSAHAYDFEVDGLYYSYDRRAVAVVGLASYDYSDIEIPETVTYEDSTYIVTGIGPGAFAFHTELESVTIPISVEHIGEQAFAWSGLKSITIPNSVFEIDDEAFYCCSELTSVYFEGYGLGEGKNIFSQCPNLTSIVVDEWNYTYDSRDNCNAIIETATNTLIVGCQSTVIPNSVTAIGDGAFNGCENLTSITIPNSVTSIGKWAFQFCGNLTNIDIPNSVTYIGRGALECTQWDDYQPNSIVYAGLVAYRYNGPMPDNTSITLDEGTIGIAEEAFGYSSNLISITLPNTLTTIGDRAFVLCNGLTNINIPNSVTFIGNEVFKDCRSLTSIILSNSITCINKETFCDCKALTSITIPNSVTYIDYYAFDGCDDLTSITCLATIPPSVNAYAFHFSTYYDATLYVPQASIEAYRAHENWGYFMRIIPFIGAGPGDTNGDGVINVADVTDLIDVLLGGGELPAYCDMNEDGVINIGDVTELIDLLLSNQ